jgi:hypothetical protein
MVAALRLLEPFVALVFLDFMLAWLILWPGRASLRIVQVLSCFFSIFILSWLLREVPLPEWPTHPAFAALVVLIAWGFAANRVARALLRDQLAQS